MRLALKHQIILAPAAVLLIMTLLLGFLQFNYWDLSVKRQEAKNLGTVFISLAEADMAARRINGMAVRMNRDELIGPQELHALQELHRHFAEAIDKIVELMPLAQESSALLRQTVHDLDPERGVDPERILTTLDLVKPQFNTLSETLQGHRERLRRVHGSDIDELVTRTALVSLITLAAAILLGILLAHTFARRILRRIKALSDSAGRVAGGDLSPPAAPERVQDELDDLSLSINRMTERLIKNVGAEKLLEGAEEERRRIAMDIHDQTLSDLSSILRGIQEMKTRQACQEEAESLEEDLQRAMGNLREVMDNLHPQTLDILGLGAALQSHLERHLAKDTLPDYHFYISPEAEEPEFSRLVRLTLYRIAVEAIHNVIKHARASRYEVTINRSNGTIVLAVEDNGSGFDLTQKLTGGGRGLNNVRERANAIGATATWGPSRFTSGTRFELTLPVPKADRHNPAGGS